MGALPRTFQPNLSHHSYTPIRFGDQYQRDQLEEFRSSTDEVGSSTYEGDDKLGQVDDHQLTKLGQVDDHQLNKLTIIKS